MPALPLSPTSSAAQTPRLAMFKFSLREILFLMCCVALGIAWWQTRYRATLSVSQTRLSTGFREETQHIDVTGRHLGWSLDYRMNGGKWVPLEQQLKSASPHSSIWIIEAPTATSDRTSIEIWHGETRLVTDIIDSQVGKSSHFSSPAGPQSLPKTICRIEWTDQTGDRKKYEFRLSP